MGLGGMAVAVGVRVERSRKGSGSSVGEALAAGEAVWVINTKSGPRVGSGVAEAQAAVSRVKTASVCFTRKLYRGRIVTGLK